MGGFYSLIKCSVYNEKDIFNIKTSISYVKVNANLVLHVMTPLRFFKICDLAELCLYYDGSRDWQISHLFSSGSARTVPEALCVIAEEAPASCSPASAHLAMMTC